MPYAVLITTAARRDYRRLPPEHRQRIRSGLLSLEHEPRARSEKLAGEDAYRLRVGDYRVVFRIDDRAREVLVARIRHRREVYRR